MTTFFRLQAIEPFPSEHTEEKNLRVFHVFVPFLRVFPVVLLRLKTDSASKKELAMLTEFLISSLYFKIQMYTDFNSLFDLLSLH
jgi:hypothetical protein